ncbi:MAG: gliding motility-associated C-terminal domain-containing protein [Bacteroidetes bacterium]|nr:gliding motility-associated C-terminal domain-containing protein [Bacteroidota bacterium]
MKHLLPVLAALLLSLAACKKDESADTIRFCPNTYSQYSYENNGDTAYCWVPNVFTPDGDGIDDMFGVSTFYVSNINVVVKDGNTVVYQATGLSDRWDGKVNGEDAAQKNYDYTVSATDDFGHSFTLTGKLSLLRIAFNNTDQIAGKVSCDSCRFNSIGQFAYEDNSFVFYPMDMKNVCEE